MFDQFVAFVMMPMMMLSQTAFLASVQICVCLRAMFMMISMMMTAAVVCGIAVDVVDITGVFRYCLFTSMLLLVVRLHTMRSMRCVMFVPRWSCRVCDVSSSCHALFPSQAQETLMDLLPITLFAYGT